ncbi:MAG: hypothetical protein HQL22_06025, partial [Candidatus Omnitrophica bacterium]|nr:hypothetical protein [Candidatus Omnitrophota bacterium]
RAKKAVKSVEGQEVTATSDVEAVAVKSAKPARRTASRLKKARSAHGSHEALASSSERSGKVAAAVAVLSEAAPAAHGKKSSVPHRGFLNAVCFWAGSVLSDGNAFLKPKKAS